MAAFAPNDRPVPLGRSDAEALWELDRLCFPPDTAFSLGAFRSLLRDRRLVGFRFGDTTVSGASASDAGGPAPSLLAFVMALRVAAAADIVTIDVHPKHRRLGLGRALLRYLHDRLRVSGTTEVTLHVAEDNAAAQQLYFMEGYALVGEARGYYPGGRDARVLRLALA